MSPIIRSPLWPAHSPRIAELTRASRPLILLADHDRIAHGCCRRLQRRSAAVHPLSQLSQSGARLRSTVGRDSARSVSAERYWAGDRRRSAARVSAAVERSGACEIGSESPRSHSTIAGPGVDRLRSAGWQFAVCCCAIATGCAADARAANGDISPASGWAAGRDVSFRSRARAGRAIVSATAHAHGHVAISCRGSTRGSITAAAACSVLEVVSIP